MNAEQKMLKARTLLILDHPFFGCLALRLKMMETEEHQTAITDGKNLLYNPSFVEKLTTQETLGFMAHEVMHAALGHTWRQGKRESKKWNMASDYTINSNLIEAGFTLPKGVLIDHTNLYDDMSAEEIYNKIPESNQSQQKKKQEQSIQPPQQKTQENQRQKQQKQTKKQRQTKKQQQQQKKEEEKKEKEIKDIDPGQCGAVIPGKEETTTKSKAEWKAAINQALQISKGKLPQCLQRQITDILDTTVPWHILLRDLVERTARNDYSWSRPNPRYFSLGIILPSLISEVLPEVAIAIDTSCSINKEQLSTFAAEASAVLGCYDTTIRIIYCDAKIQAEEVFTRIDLPLKLKLKGGGGTRFAPVFEHIKEKGYTPSCLIYFTDLYGSFPEQEPEYPTMWLVPKPKRDDNYKREAPFGQIVNF